jgi:hypothetical protein
VFNALPENFVADRVHSELLNEAQICLHVPLVLSEVRANSNYEGLLPCGDAGKDQQIQKDHLRLDERPTHSRVGQVTESRLALEPN